jgi:hypothetical protein
MTGQERGWREDGEKCDIIERGIADFETIVELHRALSKQGLESLRGDNDSPKSLFHKNLRIGNSPGFCVSAAKRARSRRYDGRTVLSIEINTKGGNLQNLNIER